MHISPLLYLVAGGHFINDIYMGFLAPLYPVVMEKFHLSLGMIGTISMAAALASALVQPLFGTLFDRYRVSAALWAAPLVTGVFVSLVGVVPNYLSLVVVLLLGCLGSAAFHPTGASVTPSLSGRQPEMGVAIFSAGGNVGFALGPLIIAAFIAAFGLRSTPFLAIPAAIMAGGIFFLLPSHSVRQRTQSVARMGWKELFSDRARRGVIIRLVFVSFCLTVASRGMQTFLPILLADSHVPLTGIGGFFTIMLALGAVISVAVSALSRITGKRPMILASILIGAPAFLGGMLLLPSLAGMLLVCLSGVALTFSSPLMILFAQNHSGNSPAIASSLLMGLSWGLGGLVMVPLGAFGEVAGVTNALIVAAAFPVLAIVSCLRIPKD